MIMHDLISILQINQNWISAFESSEAVLQRCSYEKVFWKYAANLQENIHTEVQFQQSCN